MYNLLSNINPIVLSLLATLFTFSITALGAALVYFFKKVNKTVMDAMLGFAAGVMIAASFWSLLSPSIEMAASLNMTSWLVATIGFLSGGILLFIGDKIFNYLDKKWAKKENNIKSFKRC